MNDSALRAPSAPPWPCSWTATRASRRRAATRPWAGWPTVARALSAPRCTSGRSRLARLWWTD
eukprot:9494481-Lingulodinium_polyedra.AAC.1